MTKNHYWYEQEFKEMKEARLRAKDAVAELHPQVVIDEEYDEESEERMDLISTWSRRKLKMKKHKRAKRKKKMRNILKSMRKI